MAAESLEEHGLATAFDEKGEQAASSMSYTPPVQFKLVSLPPLVQEVSSDNKELWLIRIQDSQLGPDDFKEKQVTIHLKPRDDKLGSFHSSKGIQYDVLDLRRMNGVQPFAFWPKVNEVSLDVQRIARQVAFVRSLDPDILSITPAVQEDQCQQNGELPKARSSKKKHQGSRQLHMSGEWISVEHQSVRIKSEENQARSAITGVTVGGISTVESLRENEEQISEAQLSKSAKNLEEEIFTPPQKCSQKIEKSKKRKLSHPLRGDHTNIKGLRWENSV